MSSMSNDLKVLVVSDDPLTRAGLASLLAAQSGCTVVGQVGGETDLQAALEVFQPNVLVWDLGWDHSKALDSLSDLSSERLPIVALIPDGTYAADARASGSQGILLRDSDTPSLVAALMAVTHGLLVLDPSLAEAVPPIRDAHPTGAATVLTPREQEVLQLLAEGLPNKSIADRLGITEHTVKFHVNAILGKMGAQSRTEAVTRATRLGLILL